MHRMFSRRGAALFMAAVTLCVSAWAHAEAPAVKKSKNGICHAAGSTYYALTKHYTPYPSMSACLDSGGRRPKR